MLAPAGVLPQAAWRLDTSPELWPDEVRVRVERLNLDAASFRQLREATGGGRIPAQQIFTAEPNWKKTTIPFSAFNGTDGHDISAILFVGGPKAGKFEFQIDGIKLE